MNKVVYALWAILIGAVAVLVTLPFPIVGDFWDDDSDAAKIAVIDEDRLQFALVFGLSALGLVAVGIGLFMLGTAISPMESSRGRAIAAQVGAWLGLAAAANGLSELLHALFATPEFYVDSALRAVMIVVGGISLLLAMVILGVLAWSAPPPKWTAVVLVLGGLASVIPDIAYVALAIFAAANLVALRRATPAAGVEAGPTSP